MANPTTSLSPDALKYRDIADRFSALEIINPTLAARRRLEAAGFTPAYAGLSPTMSSQSEADSSGPPPNMTPAPDPVQPATGSDAADPTRLEAGAEPAEEEEEEASASAEVGGASGTEQTGAATAERSASHAVQLYPLSYSNPPSQGTKLINVYTLTLFDNYSADLTKFSAVSLPDVQRITVQAPNAVTRTRNIAGHVYAEHGGFIQRTFVIEGRSGPVWNLPQDQHTGVLAVNRFTKLRNLIEKYGRDSVDNKNALLRNKDTRLTLQCSFESEAHFCEITSFNYRRTAETSTHSFEYTITLVTQGVVARKYRGGFALDRGKAAPVWGGFDTLNKFEVKANKQLLDRIKAENPEAAQAFNKNVFKGMSCSALKDVRLAVSAANATLDTILFTETTSNKFRTEAKKYLAWTGYGADIAHSFKGFQSLPCPISPWSDLYYDILSYANYAPGLWQALFGKPDAKGINNQYVIERENPIRTAFAVTYTDRSERPFAAVNYFLTSGITDAYEVAFQLYGDRNQCWRIINLNRLRDAYTREDGTPLASGSSLLVPDATVPAVKDNDVLGTDLLIVNGDLQLTGNNDVMRVKGYACYTQNLMHRMHTPRGSNRTFPLYGLSPTIHTDSSSTVLATIRHDIRDQVTQDHRTDEVTDLELTELGDKVQVSMVVKAIASDQRSFSFNYNLSSEVSA